jgi:hypothetical protein
LDLVGAVALYFVLWQPLLERMLTAVPQLGNIPLIERGPEIITFGIVIITLAEGLPKLVKMMSRHNAPPSYNVKAS